MNVPWHKTTGTGKDTVGEYDQWDHGVIETVKIIQSTKNENKMKIRETYLNKKFILCMQKYEGFFWDMAALVILNCDQKIMLTYLKVQIF